MRRTRRQLSEAERRDAWWFKATLREAEARAKRLETALWHFREATDWYIRCLEDVENHRVVRGLGEAKVGYDRARAALRELGEEQGDR